MERVQYVTDYDGKKIGCVLALSKDKIGWSLCNEEDHYSKEEAKRKARLRANSGKNYIQLLDEKAALSAMRRFGSTSEADKCRAMPRLYGRLYPILLQMRERAERYFK